MTDLGPAEMEVAPRKRSFWRNLSPVWLVPILAVVLALGVAWQNYASRGTLIHITWTNAAGVTPNETVLKYREVTIGVVESVGFSADLEKVNVAIRVNKDVASTFSDDVKFWVVTPEVSARGISGLSTVLSGVYIEAAWTPAQNTALTKFAGLEEAPSVRPGEKGTRVTIRAVNGASISKGAPLLFRGLEVGRLETPRLSENGESVVVNAFIEYPHDQRLNTATRFWDTSGFSVSLGPAGLDLNVSSVASLLSGGIAFDTVFSGGGKLTEKTVFDLFPDEASARSSVFNKVGEFSVGLSILFNENLTGLTAGAPVEYRGLNVGEVTALGAFIDTTPSGEVVRLRTNISINPQALGLDEGTDEGETIAFLKTAVQNGMRARLATTSLFSAALKIELVDVPEASPQLDLQYDGEIPIMPSVNSDLPDFTATAEGMLQRVNDLPIEEVMLQVTSLMASIEALVSAQSTREIPQSVLDTLTELRALANDEGLRAIPGSVAALLEDARGLVNKDATQAIPDEVRGAVAELRQLLEEFRTKGAVDALITAVNAAEQASNDVTASVTEVPALISDIRTVVNKVNDLKAEDLVASATSLLDSIDALVISPDTQAIPPAVTAALREVQGSLKDLRDGGVVTNTNEALSELRQILSDFRSKGTIDSLVAALDSAEAAGTDVAASVADVPKLIEDIRGVVAKVDNLKTDELVTSATRLLDSVNVLVDSPDTRSIPPALTAALKEVQAALKELREGGAVENTNATLASARRAADAVADATEDLPAITARLNGLVARAEDLVTAYGSRSSFNKETVDALREVRNAARAVAQLAKTIERKPNSLLIGR